MQVGIDVAYMYTNFGGRDLFGFRDIGTFKNGQISLSSYNIGSSISSYNISIWLTDIWCTCRTLLLKLKSFKIIQIICISAELKWVFWSKATSTAKTSHIIQEVVKTFLFCVTAGSVLFLWTWYDKQNYAKSFYLIKYYTHYPKITIYLRNKK